MTPAGVLGPDVHRGPGRPRSLEADQAIRRAVIDALAEESYDGLTIEGVAARAGCGKATIYRRWPSKSALVIDAIAACKDAGVELPDTGSARDDLLASVRGLLRSMRTSDVGRVLPALVVELARNAELADSFRERFVLPRRARLREILVRGVDRGELRPDLDLDLVTDALVAVFQHRLLFTGMAVDEGLPDRLVDMLWRGISTG